MLLFHVTAASSDVNHVVVAVTGRDSLAGGQSNPPAAARLASGDTDAPLRRPRAVPLRRERGQSSPVMAENRSVTTQPVNFAQAQRYRRRQAFDSTAAGDGVPAPETGRRNASSAAGDVTEHRTTTHRCAASASNGRRPRRVCCLLSSSRRRRQLCRTRLADDLLPVDAVRRRRR